MSRQGIALVLSAPSGAGKSTLIHRLVEEFPQFSYSVSCTTRAPREGETDGQDYHFLSVEEFLRRRDTGYFAEWAEVHGNFYGTPLAPVQESIRTGQDLIFDIDVQGAAQLKLTLAGALFLFILPPSLTVLEERLRNRGTDSEETIQKRLHNARQEMEESRWYDAVIVNDDLEQAYDALRACYIAATLRPETNPSLLRDILSNG